MSTNPETSTEKPFIVTNTPLVLVILGLLLIGLFSGLWWNRVYNSPRRVFDGMLANNLTTTSVTRRSTATGQQGLDRIEQLSFVAPLATRSYVKITQPSTSGETSVQTETIGTQQSDFSRYLKIEVAQADGQKPKSYASVEGIWAQSSLADGQPQYLVQAVQGLMPFANLNAAQRQKILKLIEDNKIYTVNYASSKPKRLNGKSAIDFSVSVNPSQYIVMLQELSKMIGLGKIDGLNAEDYKNQPPINLSVVVDKLSRQIIEITYGQQKETYSDYGLSRAIETPEKTIPAEELQQKIQAVQ